MDKELNKILDKLIRSDNDWLRVNDESCVHKYFDDYFIVLCRWYDEESKDNVIYIEIDDIKKGINDFISEITKPESEVYNTVLNIYETAIKKSVPAERIEYA